MNKTEHAMTPNRDPQKTRTAPKLSSNKRSIDPARISALAEDQGWDVAAHDVMRATDHRAYRLAIDEYGSQLRFLLPLTNQSRILVLRCGWGPVAFNLATWTNSVIAMDSRIEYLRFVSARASQTACDNLAALQGGLTPGLPLADRVFDAVILVNALEHVEPDGNLPPIVVQKALLEDVRRVLTPEGWLLLAIANRLGFFRPDTGDSSPHLGTFWGYRRLIHRAGFGHIQFHAPLPSHQEPYVMLPLDRWQVLDHFVDGLLTSQDYRSKLQERGMGSAYSLARTMWRIGRQLRVTGIARFVVPSYLILAQGG